MSRSDVHHRARDIAPSARVDQESQTEQDAADDKTSKPARGPSLRTVLTVCTTFATISYLAGTRLQSMIQQPVSAHPAASAGGASTLDVVGSSITELADRPPQHQQLGEQQQQQQQQRRQQQRALPLELQMAWPPDPPQPPPPPFREVLEMAASAPDARQTCLSFNREPCPPLNLSIQTPDQQRATHQRCGKFTALERSFGGSSGPVARFCGRRLPRLNPCWKERGTTSCLPHFFILGEMKCGTTTLYHLLRKHPRVVVPRVKEPRFLQPGRFAQTTVSRYKVNFDETARRDDDAVTFDASPVYLRSPAARTWISRWLPDARLITLVRDPVQRAYSHVQMGREWMASKCTQQHELHALAPLMPHLTFTALMERSLVQVLWNQCQEKLGRGPRAPASFKWLALPEAERLAARHGATLGGGGASEVDAPLYDCLVRADGGLVDKFRDELAGDYRPRARGGRGARQGGEAARPLLGDDALPAGRAHEGSMYAAELEEWAKLFPRAQLRVLHTDDLTRRAQPMMDDLFRFLGLPPIRVQANETRMCVHGKAGVMDVLNAFEGSVRIGERSAPEALDVGRCGAIAAGMHREPTTGALHHDIEPELLARMRRFYKPHNERLYRFLGRDLGW